MKRNKDTNMKTRFTMAACLCVAAFAVAGALSLTGCVKEDAGMCGSDGGSAAPDGAVTVGWQAGRLTVAGASDDNGWNAMGAKGVSSLSRSAGASTRSGLPPAGMVMVRSRSVTCGLTATAAKAWRRR